MKKKTKQIFVSHYHADADKIESLKNLIGRHGIEMRDSSIYESKLRNDATNEHYIKYELIKPQITWAGTLVVLIGDKTADSEYVDWEIRTAAEMNKNIIGVYLQGSKDKDVPPALNEYAHNLVGWNGEKIVAAINEEELDWENADGTPRSNNPRLIDHYDC